MLILFALILLMKNECIKDKIIKTIKPKGRYQIENKEFYQCQSKLKEQSITGCLIDEKGVILVIKHCTFKSFGNPNEQNQGCITVTSNGGGTDWNLDNCTFVNNFASENGAAIFIQSVKNFIISKCKFLENYLIDLSNGLGGAIYLGEQNTNVEIKDSIFINNTCGGIVVKSGLEKIYNCIFRNSIPDNMNPMFSAIYSDVSLIIDNSKFEKCINSKSSIIYINSDTILNNCSFMYCKSNSILASKSKINNLEINICIFINNKAKCIEIDSPRISIEYSKFINNDQLSINCPHSYVSVLKSKFISNHDKSLGNFHIISETLVFDDETRFQGGKSSISYKNRYPSDERETKKLNADCVENLMPALSTTYTLENTDYAYCGTGSQIRSISSVGYTVTIHHCTFYNFGSSNAYQGCITVTGNGGGSNWEITDSTFTACRAGQAGSALHLRSLTTVLIDKCTFQECTQSQWTTTGGAINVHQSCNGVTFSNSNFLNNENGGLVIRAGNSRINLEKCTFKDNVVNTATSLISPGLLTYITLKIDRCIFENNNARRCGAIGLAASVDVTLSYCEVRYCTSDNGIVLGFTSNGDITIEHSIFNSNSGSASILFTSIRSMEVDNCSFTSSGARSISVTGDILMVSASCFTYLNEVTDITNIHISADLLIIDSLSRFRGDSSTISQSSSAVFENELTCSVGGGSEEVESKEPESPTEPPTPAQTLTPSSSPAPTPVIHCNVPIDGNDILYEDYDYTGADCSEDTYFILISTAKNSIRISNCSFTNYARTTSNGGCIILSGTSSNRISSVEIIGSEFEDCTANTAGPALYATYISSKLEIIDTNFTNCRITQTSTTIPYGGTIYLGNCVGITIERSNIVKCQAGGLRLQTTCTVESITECGFIENEPAAAGAISGVYSNSVFTLTKCLFQKIVSARSMIYCGTSATSCTLDQCRLIECDTGTYNSIYATSTAINLQKCYFYHWTAPYLIQVQGTSRNFEFVDSSFVTKEDDCIQYTSSQSSFRINNCCFSYDVDSLTSVRYIFSSASATHRNKVNINSRTQFKVLPGVSNSVLVSSFTTNNGNFVKELECMAYGEQPGDLPTPPVVEPVCSLDIFSDFERSNEIHDGSTCNSYYAKISATATIVKIEKCRFSNYFGRSWIYDGCITCDTTSAINSITVSESTFYNCICKNGGSALYLTNVGQSSTIIDCSFQRCDLSGYSTDEGGAIMFQQNSNNIAIELCRFDECFSGGIFINERENTVDRIKNCTFNKCDSSANFNVCPGIHVNASCTIDECFFISCVGGFSGAILSGSCDLIISLCLFIDCTSRSGNIVHFVGSNSIKIEKSLFSLNSATATNKAQILLRNSADVKVEQTSFVSDGSTSLILENTAAMITGCCFSLSSIDLNSQSLVHVNNLNEGSQIIIDSKTKFQGTEATVSTSNTINRGKFTTEMLECFPYDENAPQESEISVDSFCGIDITEDFVRSDSTFDGLDCIGYFAKIVGTGITIRIERCQFTNYLGTFDNFVGCITTDANSNARILEVIDSSFTSCNSVEGGAAMYLDSISENVTIEDCKFTSCRRTSDRSIAVQGGTIMLNSNCANIKIDTCEFESCSMGGILIGATGNTVDIIDNCTFSRCITTNNVCPGIQINATGIVSNCKFISCSGNIFGALNQGVNSISVIECQFIECASTANVNPHGDVTEGNFVLYDKCYFYCNTPASNRASIYLRYVFDGIIRRTSFVNSVGVSFQVQYSTGNTKQVIACCFSYMDGRTISSGMHVTLSNSARISIDSHTLLRGTSTTVSSGVTNNGMFIDGELECKPYDNAGKCGIMIDEGSYELKDETIDGENCVFGYFAKITGSAVESVVIEDCVFTNYKEILEDYSGCITCTDSASTKIVTITKTTFTTCVSVKGGSAIYLNQVTEKTTINECDFNDCQVTDTMNEIEGGCILLKSNCNNIRIGSCTISKCKSGGIYIGSNNIVESIINNTFDEIEILDSFCTAGIHTLSSMSLQLCKFVTCTDLYSCIFYAIDSSVTMTECEFTTCTSLGANIIHFEDFTETAMVTIDKCFIARNSADLAKSQIYLDNLKTVIIERTSFVTDESKSVIINDCTARITSCCFQLANEDLIFLQEHNIQVTGVNSIVVIDPTTTIQGFDTSVTISDSITNLATFTEDPLECKPYEDKEPESYVYVEPTCNIDITTDLVLENQEFDGSQCLGYYAKVIGTDLSIRIELCKFSDFRGDIGLYQGCITLDSTTSLKSVVVLNSSFLTCNSMEGGSAMYLNNVNEDVKISDCDFEDCKVTRSSGKGGSLLFDSNCKNVVIDDSRFLNVACGGIYIGETGNVISNILSCTFSGSMTEGANIPCIHSNSDCRVEKSTFSTPLAATSSIVFSSGSVTLIRCTISHNEALENAMLITNTREQDFIMIDQCTFNDNNVLEYSLCLNNVFSASIQRSAFISFSSKSVSISNTNANTVHFIQCCFSAMNLDPLIHITVSFDAYAEIDAETTLQGTSSTVTSSNNVVNKGKFTNSADLIECKPAEDMSDCGIKVTEGDYSVSSEKYDGSSCPYGYFAKIVGADVQKVSIVSCSFINYKNSADDYDGCITCGPNSRTQVVEIIDTEFVSCFSNNGGSAIYLHDVVDQVFIERCDFKSCDLISDGEGTILLESNCNNIKVESCEFDSCPSGGIIIGATGNTVDTIKNCTFNKCVSISEVCPGIKSGVSITVENCEFVSCSSVSAVLVCRDSLSLIESQVKECTSDSNNIINVSGSNANIERCFIYLNSAPAIKSQIYFSGVSDVVILESSFVSSGTTSIIFDNNVARVSRCCFSFEGAQSNLIHINSLNDLSRIIIDSRTTFKGDETTVSSSTNIKNSGKFNEENVCGPYDGSPESESFIEVLQNCALSISENYLLQNGEFDSRDCLNYFAKVTGTGITINIENCRFSEYVGGLGAYEGCITCDSSSSASSFEIVNTSFTKCSSQQGGSALFINNIQDKFEIIGCKFIDCSRAASSGDGGTILVDSNTKNIKIESSTFNSCSCGCIIIGSTGNTIDVIKNCDFENCDTGNVVSAIEATSSIRIEGCKFIDNHATSAGTVKINGAASPNNAFNFVNCHVIRCKSDSDRVVYSYSSSTSVSQAINVLNCFFDSNEIQGTGTSYAVLYFHNALTNSRIERTSFISSGSRSFSNYKEGYQTIIVLEKCCFSLKEGTQPSSQIHVANGRATGYTCSSNTIFQGTTNTVVGNAVSGTFVTDLVCYAFEDAGCDYEISDGQLEVSEKEFDGTYCFAAFNAKVTGAATNILIHSCNFTNYEKTDGNNDGCITFGTGGSASLLEVVNTIFTKCATAARGSALFISSVSDVLIDNCKFIECSITSSTETIGGAVAFGSNCNKIVLKSLEFDSCTSNCLSITTNNVVNEISNCVFMNSNTARPLEVTCIYSAVDYTLSNCQFVSNTGAYNLIYNLCQTITLIDVLFEKNAGTYVLYPEDQTFEFVRCTFSDNTPRDECLYLSRGSRIDIDSCNFISNGKRSISINVAITSLAIKTSCFSIMDGVETAAGIHISATDIDSELISVDSDTRFGGGSSTVSGITLNDRAFSIINLVCPMGPVEDDTISLTREEDPTATKDQQTSPDDQQPVIESPTETKQKEATPTAIEDPSLTLENTPPHQQETPTKVQQTDPQAPTSIKQQDEQTPTRDIEDQTQTKEIEQTATKTDKVTATRQEVQTATKEVRTSINIQTATIEIKHTTVKGDDQPTTVPIGQRTEILYSHTRNEQGEVATSENIIISKNVSLPLVPGATEEIDSGDSTRKLSGGAIAGIVIGVLVFVAIVAVLIVMLVVRPMMIKHDMSENNEMELAENNAEVSDSSESI